MPNGESLNEKLEYKERLKNMTPDERVVFIGEQIFELSEKVEEICSRGASKKASALTSGITAGVLIGIAEGIKSLLGKS